ncbi:hypothetical protein [Halocatena halophila]|uniref:hypothetical protein n=1 Tax=Halocatena halophila TaxID=2814576 RepID=UPI002ED694FF
MTKIHIDALDESGTIDVFVTVPESVYKKAEARCEKQQADGLQTDITDNLFDLLPVTPRYVTTDGEEIKSEST